MQEIEDAIQTEDGYHPVTGRHYTEYIDLESWADKYLVEEITRNNGGGSTLIISTGSTASKSLYYTAQSCGLRRRSPPD